MKLAAVVIAAVAASGGAAARAPAVQEPAADGPIVTRPSWVKRPSADDLVAVWPAEALARGIGGRAKIRCQVSQEGTLRRCEVMEESPAGSGFGYAAMLLTPQFAMSPQTIDGEPVGGGTVTIPIVFQGSGVPSVTRGAPRRAVGSRYATTPNWIGAPTRAQVATAYPARALQRGESGRATLDCEIRTDGALRDCNAAEQEPGNAGFGRAALSLTSLFRIEPPRDESGEAARRVRVRFPVNFSPSVAEADSPQIARPEWGRLPGAAEVAFPAAAKAAGLTEGRVTLDCLVQPGGAVGGCSVANETPAGMGFGEAALKLAPAFTMRAWTSDGRPVDGARVRIPVRYEP